MIIDDNLNNSDDDDVPETVHNSLIKFVSQLDRRKKLHSSTLKRKRSTLSSARDQVENAAQKKKHKVQVRFSTEHVGKRAANVEISQHTKSGRKLINQLPKHLERPQAEKIKRIVGYENLKRDLNKWNSIVYHNRVAEQVRLPLNEPTIQVHDDSTDFLTTFRTPTELEIKMAEILNSEKGELSKHDSKEDQQSLIPMSLKEMQEQRKLLARTRAQQRYKEAKAARQNKIKSKKFHRILRKEKMKAQVKEFEELQKTDPEAALKKLEQLEKVRAQERASLRHRTTGQWARNLQVRAKYDKEARIALAEQLQQSRELTKKLRNDSSDEEFDKVEDSKSVMESSDQNNPWMNNKCNSIKQNSEVQEFYSNYKKFWEEKEKESEAITSEKSPSKPENNTRVIDKASDFSVTVDSKTLLVNSSSTVDVVGNGKLKNNFNEILNGTKENVKFKVTSGISSPKKINDKKTSRNNKIEVTFSTSAISRPKKRKEPNNSKIEVTFSVLKKHRLNPSSNEGLKRSMEVACSKTQDEISKYGNWSVTTIKPNITRVKSKRKNKKSKCDKKDVIGKEIENVSSKSQLNLDDMFFKVEDKLQEKVQKKVKTFQQNVDKFISQTESDRNVFESNNEDYSGGLEMKKIHVTADIDEGLSENPNENTVNENSTMNSIKKSVTFAKEVEKTNQINSPDTTDIEPIKTSQIKPKFLKTQVPTSLADGEETLDDGENYSGIAEESHMTILEAFTDDNVVKEFEQEKEEEIKSSQVEDVNLVLPGWGSWAGHNIKPSEHKRKRFIVKFPKVLPRRDENKGNVVINEDKDETAKPHLVSDLPFPFTSVKEYEASIRLPLGSTWLPQRAHRKLIAPAVVTKMGTIIEPMTEEQIVQMKNKSK